jgi:hypothetical protein
MIRGALIAVALLLSWAHAYPLAGQPGAVTAAHSVQGALVDIRYGQVCLDHGGISSVLETLPQTRIWLDGSPITADDLQKRVPEGLIAVATGPGNGFVDSLEVYTGGLRLPAVGVEALPWIGPAYRAGETLTLLLPESEVKRVGGRPLSLSIPGVARDLPMRDAQRGGVKAVLKVPEGSDLNDVPVLVRQRSRVFKGPRLTFSSSPPRILDFGPAHASHSLPVIPGWIDLSSPARLLDLSTASLTVSAGARVVSFVPRVDRTLFEIQADGPGEYWLEFSIADRLGRTARQRWPLRVRP